MTDEQRLIGGAIDPARRGYDAIKCEFPAVVTLRYKGESAGLYSYCVVHRGIADNERIFPLHEWTKEELP